MPLTVFAASSLEEAFAHLAHGFEQTHPGVDVRLNFAGSQILRMQIEQGARADVFASANEAHMAALADAGLVDDVTVFARNELVVIVPAGARAPASFTQLPEARRIVLGSPNVPVGRYAREVLARAEAAGADGFARAVARRVVSEESNVRLVRAKVEIGEADAALVYATDAASSPGVRALPIPADLNVQASYPIAPVAASPHAHLARAFIQYVRSEAGQRALRRTGFAGATP